MLEVNKNIQKYLLFPNLEIMEIKEFEKERVMTNDIIVRQVLKIFTIEILRKRFTQNKKRWT